MKNFLRFLITVLIIGIIIYAVYFLVTQNKIYKQQYDLLNAKEKNLNNDTIEKRIDKLKNENNELIKQITLLKTQSRLEEKKNKKLFKQRKIFIRYKQNNERIKNVRK